MDAAILAYHTASGLDVAGFDLQRTRHRLPHVRQTLPDVQHRDVHVGHPDGAVGPQLEVVHGALVRLDIAAPEQLCGPVGGSPAAEAVSAFVGFKTWVLKGTKQQRTGTLF